MSFTCLGLIPPFLSDWHMHRIRQDRSSTYPPFVHMMVTAFSLSPSFPAKNWMVAIKFPIKPIRNVSLSSCRRMFVNNDHSLHILIVDVCALLTFCLVLNPCLIAYSLAQLTHNSYSFGRTSYCVWACIFIHIEYSWLHYIIVKHTKG